MQFSEKESTQTVWERLSSQPHRLFFATSIFWAVTLMAFSLGSFTVLKVDFSIIHGIGMIYGVFVNAFLGFLSTVIPRYTQSIEIPKNLFYLFWLLYQIGLILWFIGFTLTGQLFSGIALIIAGVVFYQTVRIGRYPDEPDSLWLVSLIFISGLLLVIELFVSFPLFWSGIWVCALPITFIVAQRMIPFFYASYFGKYYNKPRWVVPFFVLGSLGIAVGGESSLLTSLLSFILSIGTTYFLWTLNIYKKAPAILWILTFGFLWLPVGLFVTSIESFLRLYSLKMGIHILLIGFIFTLLIGFGTRVLLGHSGQQVTADFQTKILFALAGIVLIFRIIISVLFILNSPTYTTLIIIDFILFITVMILWAMKYRKAIF